MNRIERILIWLNLHLLNSSPNSASIDIEESTDDRADNDLVAENEADISEKLEEPQVKCSRVTNLLSPDYKQKQAQTKG